MLYIADQESGRPWLGAGTCRNGMRFHLPESRVSPSRIQRYTGLGRTPEGPEALRIPRLRHRPSELSATTGGSTSRVWDRVLDC